MHKVYSAIFLAVVLILPSCSDVPDGGGGGGGCSTSITIPPNTDFSVTLANGTVISGNSQEGGVTINGVACNY